MSEDPYTTTDPALPARPARNFTEGELYRIQVLQRHDYAMFLTNPDGILITWNSGVEKLLGYSEQEWIGQHASLIFTPADRAVEVCEAEMRKARESGTAADIRWHRRKDGTEFFANGLMNAVYDDSGILIGYTKIMNDETPRKLMEDALTESNAALEQFAYMASHDLQEPIRTISSYAQLLKRRYASRLDNEAEVFLSFMVNASTRMSMLIRDLLAYARVTTAQQSPCSVNLDDDLEAALSHLAQTIEETGGRVTHDPLPTVHADRGQMIQLFQNLVGNALKYRRKGKSPRVHVAAVRHGPEWVISVEDNGIGFDPAHAPLLFAPFKRLHNAAEYPGSGVGLAICRRIVEAHGGRIWAESKPDSGAIFRFSLPAEA